LTINLVIQRPVVTNNTPDDADITQWITVFSTAVLAHGEVTVRIVNSEEMTNLNRRYRNINKPTNVLSFPFVDPPGVRSGILGDIVICAQIVATEALQQHIPIHHHWAHMLAHGLLHLQGLDHQQTTEAEKMERLEKDLLATLQIPDPYVDEYP